MRSRSSFLVAVTVALCLGDVVTAQFPDTATGGAAGGGAAAGSSAGGSAQQATTIWSKLGLSQEGLAKHKKKFCASGLGTLVKSMFAPIKLATGGGLLPPCCPDVLSADDLKKLDPTQVSESESAAAKIKADEAQAKQRIAAVEYLATVDCHYWPEAEKGLISALRADKNECVRFAAAKALANGCCCTKKTVEALQITVSGSEKDGNPYEKSERVKQTAFLALHRCIAKMQGQVLEPQPPEPPLAEPKPPEKSISFYRNSKVRQVALFNRKRSAPAKNEVLKDALRAYASNVGAPQRRPDERPAPQNLFDMWRSARRSAPPELPPAPSQSRPQSEATTLRPIGEMPLMLPEHNASEK